MQASWPERGSKESSLGFPKGDVCHCSRDGGIWENGTTEVSCNSQPYSDPQTVYTRRVKKCQVAPALTLCSARLCQDAHDFQ